MNTPIQITTRPYRYDASLVEVSYPELNCTLGRFLVSHRELSKFIGVANYLAILATKTDENGRAEIDEDCFVKTGVLLAESADESLSRSGHPYA